jgi:hypothetical protein
MRKPLTPVMSLTRDEGADSFVQPLDQGIQSFGETHAD